MHHWTKRLFAIAAPLLLTSCLWGPGKFNSDLTLRKDGSFTLDYRGEIVLQLPKDEFSLPEWKDSQAICFDRKLNFSAGQESAPLRIVPSTPSSPLNSSAVQSGPPPVIVMPKSRTCTPAEIAQQKSDYEKNRATMAAKRRADAEKMAKMFGLPGVDDESSKAFAAKLMKFAGWQSVTYRGNGVFDVDYHFVGRVTQDFLFPALPDNNFIVPFVAIRRRADGSVLVDAPGFTGGAGPFGAGAATAEGMNGGPVSRAEGRFTVVTDGEFLTNNSEDGPAPNATGRAVHWDVSASSNKVPETLIRL
jgi:hypothetical protein